MVSTPEGITENSSIYVRMPGNMINPNAQKLISHFSELLNVKHKTDVWILRYVKTKCKAIRTVNMLWSSITNRIGHTKTNACINQSLYDLVLRHPHVVHSPIENN